jgi:hypothetical protein
MTNRKIYKFYFFSDPVCDSFIFFVNATLQRTSIIADMR